MKNNKIFLAISIFLAVFLGLFVASETRAYYDYGFNYNNNYGNYYGQSMWSNYYMQTVVQTGLARSIEDDEAIISGRIYPNKTNYSYIWFEYGRNPNYLNGRTPEMRINSNYPIEFSKRITNLNEDTRYFFRAVSRGKNGMISYGTISSFVTDGDNYDNDSNDEDTPEVSTGNSTSITDNSAKVKGSVDMNDFENGLVFFLYGEDEDQIENVVDDYDTYNSIDEDGSDLQKVKADSGLDDQKSYTLEIYNLDEDTDYYYSVCVQYENEDGDDEIICGDVKNFTTDED